MDRGGANLGSARGDVFIGVDSAIRNVRSLGKEITGLGGVAGAAAPGMTAIGVAAGVAGGAVLAGIGDAVGAAMSFEKQISAVAAAIGTEALPQLDALSEKALQIGADTSFGANQAAMAMEELAKAGVSAEDILGGVADSTVHLAEAIGADLPTAAGLMTSAMNVFGISAEDSSKAADTITAAINESSASIPDFLGGMRNLGPVVANFGGDLDDAAAAIAYFTNFGLKGADAGVSLARGLTMAAKPTDEARAKMDELGLSVFDLEGKFVGFPALFDNLQTSMSGLSDQEREAALSMIFGAEAADVMSIAIKNGADGYEELLAAVQPANQAAETASTRLDNLAGDAEKLSGALETARIRIGQGFTPSLRIAAQAATLAVDAFNELPVPLQQAVGYATAAAGGLLLLGSAAVLSGGRVGVMVSQLRALNFGLALIPPQARLAIAAAAGIGLAYKTNFLGVRDLVDEGRDRVEEFGDDFMKVFDRIRSESQTQDYLGGGMFTDETAPQISRVNAGLRAFGSALEDLTGIEQSQFWLDLAGHADTVGDAVERLRFHFDNLRAGGLNPVNAGLGAVAATLRSMFGDNALAAGIADAFSLANVSVDAFLDDLGAAGGKVGDGLRDLIVAAFEGDLFSDIGLDAGRQILAGLGDALAAAPKAMGRFLKGVRTGIGPIDRILNRGGRAVESFGRLIQEIGQGDVQGAIDVAQRTLRQLGETAGVVGEEGGAAFREFGRGITGLADEFPVFRGELEGLGRGVQGFGDAFEGVFTGDWQQALDGAGDMLSGFGSAALAGLSTIGDGAVAAFDAIPWGAIGSAVRDAAVTAFQNIPWSDVWATAETLLGAAAEGGIQLLSVGVDILDWAWGEVKDLGSWLADALLGTRGDGTGGPEAVRSGGVAARLASVGVDVLDWAWNEVLDLGGWTVDHLDEIWDATIVVAKVSIDILAWAWGELPDLGKFLRGIGSEAPGSVAGRPETADPAAAGASIDVSSVLVNVLGYAWGELADLRGFVRGGLLTSTKGQGGPGQGISNSVEYDMPDPIVNVLGYIKGEIADVWDDVEDWVQGEGDQEITVAPGTVHVAEPAEIDDDRWWDFIDRHLEDEVGVDIELQNWRFHLNQQGGDLELADFWAFIDRSIEDFIGLDIELQTWTFELTGSGVVGVAPSVIKHIDDSLERMFKVDIELQNPLGDAANTVAGWFAPVIGAFQDAYDSIIDLRKKITNALRADEPSIQPNITEAEEDFGFFDASREPVDVIVPVNLITEHGGVDQASLDALVAENQARIQAGMLPIDITTFLDPTYEPVAGSTTVDPAVLTPEIGDDGLVVVDVKVQPRYEFIGPEGAQRASEDAAGFFDPAMEPGIALTPIQPPPVAAADTTAFKASIDTAVGDAVNKLGTVDDIPAKAVFAAEAGQVATTFTDVMQWGGIWDAQTPEASFLAEHGDAAVKFTDVMTWGDLWEQFVGTGSFDGDDSDAQNAANAAFGAGHDWDGQVFTASFAVDTSGITDAVAVARQAAADIAAILPNSPAKEGPLRKVPDFGYIAEAAERDLAGIGETISRSLAYHGVASFAGAAGGAAAGTAAPGGRTVYVNQTRYQIVTLPTEEWLRTARNAEIGAEYAYAMADESLLGGPE